MTYLPEPPAQQSTAQIVLHQRLPKVLNGDMNFNKISRFALYLVIESWIVV